MFKLEWPGGDGGSNGSLDWLLLVDDLGLAGFAVDCFLIIAVCVDLEP